MQEELLARGWQGCPIEFQVYTGSVRDVGFQLFRESRRDVAQKAGNGSLSRTVLSVIEGVRVQVGNTHQ